MSPESWVLVGLGVCVALASGLLLYRRWLRRSKTADYASEWRSIQKMCRNKDDWAHAIIHADMFLEQVLEQKKFAGKTMGERMVAAEKEFSKRDDIWAAHKLANSLRKDADVTMTKKKTKDALMAYQHAFKDLEIL